MSHPSDLPGERARRWWQTRRPVASLQRAAAFIDDVGFALLFPARGVELPTLFQAVSQRPQETEVGWGPEAEQVWGWKDELPRKGLAWYGRFLRGRSSFLSPTLLSDLYPWAGDPEDFTRTDLEPEARSLAEILLLSGPTSTEMLREALGAEGRQGKARFNKALRDLGRALLITHYGTEDRAGGWPAAIIELTARAFPLCRGKRGREVSLLPAAERFVHTMIVTQPRDLARAFGWSAAEAREALETLVARRKIATDGDGFVSSRR